MDINSAQHKAIQCLHEELVESVSSEHVLDFLINKAWSKNLVEKRQSLELNSSDHLKAVSFVSEITSKVRIDISVFDQFVSLLREMPSLECLATLLEDEFKLILERELDNTNLSASAEAPVSPISSPCNNRRPSNQMHKLDLDKDNHTQTVESGCGKAGQDMGTVVGCASGKLDFAHIPQSDEELNIDQGLNMSTHLAFESHYRDLVLGIESNVKSVADECRQAFMIGKDLHGQIMQRGSTDSDNARILLSAVGTRIASQASEKAVEPDKCAFTIFIAILRKDPSTVPIAEELATARIDLENRAKKGPCTEEPSADVSREEVDIQVLTRQSKDSTHSTFSSTLNTGDSPTQTSTGAQKTYDSSVKIVHPETATSRDEGEDQVVVTSFGGINPLRHRSLGVDTPQTTRSDFNELFTQKHMIESQLESLKKQLDSTAAENKAQFAKTESELVKLKSALKELYNKMELVLTITILVIVALVLYVSVYIHENNACH